jgi:predicted ATP-dependent endonuclease of OLD family
MKIIELKAENIKRIKAVTIKPDGQSVVIGGDNEQGKSSVLDSILYALGGGSAACEKPVRDGEKLGAITLDLGELIVTRKFTENNSSLVVKTKAGDLKTSPQKVLDTLVGKLTFDPLEFARMEARDQRKHLAVMVGLNTSDIDQKHIVIYATRTTANRELATLKSSVVGFSETPGLPDVEVSAESLMAELEKAQAANNAIVQAGAEASRLEQRLNSYKGNIKAQKEKLQKMEADLAFEKEFLAKLESEELKASEAFKAKIQEARNLPLINEAPYKQAIAGLTEKNQAIRKNNWLKTQRAKIAASETTIDGYTNDLLKLQDEKAKRIADAKYPLEGLSVTEDAVLFNGIPIKQASTAQQIKISAAIAIALNPKLRVMMIREGSLLDNRSLLAIQEMAVDNNMQLWIERVGAGDEVSVVIEDGEIKENRL